MFPKAQVTVLTARESHQLDHSPPMFPKLQRMQTCGQASGVWKNKAWQHLSLMMASVSSNCTENKSAFAVLTNVLLCFFGLRKINNHNGDIIFASYHLCQPTFQGLGVHHPSVWTEVWAKNTFSSCQDTSQLYFIHMNHACVYLHTHTLDWAQNFLVNPTPMTHNSGQNKFEFSVILLFIHILYQASKNLWATENKNKHSCREWHWQNHHY